MRVLIVNCTPSSAEAVHILAGGRSNEAHFAESLRLHDARIETTTVQAADDGLGAVGLPLSDFDGAILTGSPWGVYEDRREIPDQIALARRLYEDGVPVFGSCYGLQLMAKALGGDVHVNPRGREVGVARAITLNEAGKAHAMLAGKPAVFDALCSHQDEVSRVPAGGVVLASNDVSHVQAMTVDRGASSFWGVQYHPEFDFLTIASILERTSARNIAEGLARDASEMAAVVADMRALSGRDGGRSIAWRMGLKPDVLDQRQRTAEFGAWLRQRVAPRVEVGETAVQLVAGLVGGG
ncbi:MAG TPA: type 1 glutamine amidotransferase, partial [Hyphomicrobiaceae bacterium]|nr:type 1 glutamine amidotransferase [Hyphomicrobiaceae bacterium]